jgi:SAM-dependent methyltransferase
VLVRVGSRGSRLALTQAERALSSLRAPGIELVLVPITTAGDRDRSRPFGEIGSRGVFVKELEEALLDRRIDIAVHSAKDLTAADPEGLVVGAYPRREDPRDALCGAAALRPGMRIGTASVRRKAQLLALEPTLSTAAPDTTPAAGTDWSAGRGEQWRANLAGMEEMLAPVDEPLIAALQLDAPHRIAEVGCGGGGTALELLRRAPAGSVVHGFDISPALIDIARRRAGDIAGHGELPAASAIAFETADMATATAPGEPYRRLVSRFGIMFFDDPPAAFANLVRWLVPGGRFAFAVWGPPADNPWFSIRDVVAEIVDVPPLDPEAPGPFRYAEVDKLLTLLERAGFGELDAGQWRGTLPIGGKLTAPEAATFALAAFSSFGDLLARAGTAALDEAHRALTARFAQHRRDGAVQLGASVHIVTGVRSGAA